MTPSRLGLHLIATGETLTVHITPPAPPPLAALIVGKDPDTAAAIVGRLFNICGAAQEAAARSAFDRPVDPAVEHRVALETLREHGVKLCLLWPDMLGLSPDRVAPPLLARALDDEAANSALRAALFGGATGLPGTWPTFEAWMSEAETVPALCLKRIHDTWDPAWGRADLPGVDIRTDWPDPRGRDHPVDNGVGDRVADHPLMAAIEDRLGRGMLWRMTARLVELDALLTGTAPSPFKARGVVQAARGTLFVRGTTDDAGRVTTLERLTPTDFALIPGGALETALRGLPPDLSDLEAKARLTIDVVDPCIGVDLTIAALPRRP